MTYPVNIPSINDMLNMPAGELSQMPVDLLVALQSELDHASKQLKAANTRFGTALEVRYATRAEEARRGCGIVENTSKTFGYDAQLEQYGDMLKAGIIDPTKVVRIALQHAASIASLLITTEAMVADKPAKSGGNAMSGMDGMGGMGGMM